MNIEYFDSKQIAESGQTFRWYEVEEGYVIIHQDEGILLKQSHSKITIVPMTTYTEELWQSYLDLTLDYGHVVNQLKGKDDYLDSAIEFGKGIRILKQDPYEMIMTFIISANNNIKRITSSVKQLSERYGHLLFNHNGVNYYSFPSAEQLCNLTKDDFRACGVGYRDQYLLEFVNEVNNGYQPDSLNALNDKELKQALLRLKGVGEKVANCILLFGYYRLEGFPIDTWIKKVLLEHYPVKENELKEFAESYFKPYGGIAQQYLFYYGRMK
jgi:N-glycosylase/DNA lyase